MKQFEGRVAVVTGAGSGIGRELAIACAERGMKLVLADVDIEGLAATKDLISGGTAVRTRQCDVSSFEAVQDLANLAFSSATFTCSSTTRVLRRWAQSGPQLPRTGNGCLASICWELPTAFKASYRA